MAERIVDALELVDVDVLDGEQVARTDLRDVPLQPLMEQGAVWQIGQGIIMGEVGDALFGAPALGDVLVRSDPAAARERLIDDLDRTSVRRLYDGDLFPFDVAQHGRDIFIFVAGERSRGLAMRDDVSEAAARFDDVG